jgi:acyl-CoA synthetase (AMP-forming)/AMP-acid ligase II
MALEPFTSVLARSYLRRIGDTEPTQRALLRAIVSSCADGAVGKSLGLQQEMSFEEYLGVPPQEYAFYYPFVQRILEGEDCVFGSEPIIALGETSGSTGKPKLVPHTASSLACIAQFTRLTVLFQLWHSPHYFPRFTRWLLITASSSVRLHKSIAIGFISGLMYRQAQSARKISVLPSPSVAAIESWDERIRQTVVEAVKERVGTLFGVPAYLERFLAQVALHQKTAQLQRVWPLLDEIYYSGTGIEAHRSVLQAYFDRPLITRSLYMATEGLFAAELDAGAGGWMRLLPDMAVYTFRDVDDEGARLRGMWELQPGRRYELLVTTRSGLCQYRIGDILEVEGPSPIRVRIAGRVGDEINIATEKLSSKQAQATLAGLAAEIGVSAARFLVLPDPLSPRLHLWVLEQERGIVASDPAAQIDRRLAEINSSYAALRVGDAVLEKPRVVLLPPGSFDAYVQSGFKKRGQFKFPHVFPSWDRLRAHADLANLIPLSEGTLSE